MIGQFLLAAALVGACHCLTLTIAPFNTSAPIGQTGTLACIAANIGSDTISWKKKQTTGSSYDFISSNAQILSSAGATKYALSGTYNLTIKNVDSSDTGIYQCAAGSIINDISFTAVVLPTNVSVYWESSPISGNRVNITCRATYGNPPPLLKWFKGTNDLELTNNAYYYTENVRSSGYGDSVSTMIMQLTDDDRNQEIRCEAAYEGYERAMEYTLNIQLSGGPSLRAQGFVAAIFVLFCMVFKSVQ